MSRGQSPSRLVSSQGVLIASPLGRRQHRTGVAPAPVMLLLGICVGFILCVGVMIAAPRKAVAKTTTKTTTRTDSVTLGALMQLRHAYTPAVDDPATASDEGVEPALNSFTLRRARLRFKAKHGATKLRGGFGFSKGKPRLLSLYFAVKLPGKIDLRMGQTKRLLTASYLASSTVQRQIERSPIGDKIGSNRDVGLRLRRRFFRRFVAVQLAIFNGNGANTVSNDTGALLLEGRLDVHLIRRLDLGDPTLGRKLAIVVGGAVSRGAIAASRFKSGVRLTRVDSSQAWSLHGAVRWQRVELRMELLRHNLTPEDDRIDRSSALGIAGVSEGGWSVQIAWQPPLLSRRLELSARLFRWQDDRVQGDTSKEDVEATIGWRLRGNRLKLQAAWRRKMRARAGGQQYVTHRAQLQLQAEM